MTDQDHDNDPLGDRLRRAVTTLPAADPDWPATARRVRRARAGRTAARIGIPAACALLAVGGVAVLSGRDGEQMSGSPAISPVAATTTLPVAAATTTTAVSVAPSDAVRPTVVATTVAGSGEASAPGPASFGDVASWPVVGRPSTFRTTLEVRAFEIVDAVCVAAAPAGEVPTWSWCGSAGRYGVRLLGNRLQALGTVPSGSNVRVATDGGTADVPTFVVGGTTVFAAVLPDGAELTGVGDTAVPTACPYRPILRALAASDDIASDHPRVASVVRCAAGYAGLYVSGGSTQQGGAAVLRADGDQWTVLNVGLVCETPVGTEAVACAALGWTPASDASAVPNDTTPTTVDREPVGGQETIPTLPAA